MSDPDPLDALALESFASANAPESIAPGATIFAEAERGDRVYVLLHGEVDLLAQGKVIETVAPGGIFGEIEVMAQADRISTAVAKGACSTIGLDRGQFQTAMQRNPAFALAMIGVMARRLPGTIKRILARGIPKLPPAGSEFRFDRTMQPHLVQALGRDPVRYTSLQTIIEEGMPGRTMYVVLEGRVAFARKGVNGDIARYSGPGGVVGEMALIGRWPAGLIAIACAGCVLLAIDRDAFLDLVRTRPELGVALLSGIAERANCLVRHAQ